MMLNKAIKFATAAHSGMVRKSLKNGFELPYITHPISVMKQVWNWGLGDEITMSAAVLHDVVEDTSVTLTDIESNFGADVSRIVDELTFISGDKAEYLRSFNTKSYQALCIKVADRLENVFDFLDFDPKYAEKYMRKANDLFAAYEGRKSVLIKSTSDAIDNSISHMRMAVNQNREEINRISE